MVILDDKQRINKNYLMSFRPDTMVLEQLPMLKSRTVFRKTQFFFTPALKVHILLCHLQQTKNLFPVNKGGKRFIYFGSAHLAETRKRFLQHKKKIANRTGQVPVFFYLYLNVISQQSFSKDKREPNK